MVVEAQGTSNPANPARFLQRSKLIFSKNGIQVSLNTIQRRSKKGVWRSILLIPFLEREACL